MRARKGNRGARLAAALAAGLAFGCAAPGLGPAPPVGAPAGAPPVPEEAARRALAEPLWPPSVMTQRAILKIGGTDLAMDGRLAVNGSGAVRLVAVGTLGQILFDVLVEPGGAARLLRVGPAFREDWVRSFAGRDARTVFQAPPAQALRFGAVRDPAPASVLWREEAPGEAGLRYLIAPYSPVPWVRFEEVRAGQCVYRASVVEVRRFANLDRALPSRVRIEAVDYELDLRIVDLKPGAPPEQLFRTAVGGTTDEHR